MKSEETSGWQARSGKLGKTLAWLAIATLVTVGCWARVAGASLAISAIDALSQDESSNPAATQQDDPYDSNPAYVAQAEEEVSRYPAVQLLPLNFNGVHADLYDRDTDGRLVILVEHSGPKSAAEKVWLNFLAKAHDRATNYRVIYVKR